MANSREEYFEEQKALYELKRQGGEREDYGYERTSKKTESRTKIS